MSLLIALAAVMLLAAAAGWLGYVRARRLRVGGRMHSLPVYHGMHAALWAAIPALLVLAAWAPVQHRLVDQAVMESPQGQALPDFGMQRDAILSEARGIAEGSREAGFNPESATIAPVIPRGGEADEGSTHGARVAGPKSGVSRSLSRLRLLRDDSTAPPRSG